MILPPPLPGEELATALTRPFWEGIHRGRLVLQRCLTCGRWQHYPRRVCRFCWRDELGFAAASGRGELVACVVSHRTPKPELRDQLPMALGLVRLDEGPVLLARLERELGAGDQVAFADDATLRRRLLTFAPTHPPPP
jgi:uncharacterized OB-fold protein